MLKILIMILDYEIEKLRLNISVISWQDVVGEISERAYEMKHHNFSEQISFIENLKDIFKSLWKDN